MKVAIIILNFNDHNNTVNYVNSIKEYKNIDKIIVVDNCSTNPDEMSILSNLKSDKVDIVQSEKNGGYSYGNNYGVRYLEESYGKYDYIIISNPDIKVSENAIDKCIQALNENEDFAIVAPKMMNKDGEHIRRSSWKIRTFALDVVHSTRLLELIFYWKLRSGEYSEKEYLQDYLEVEAISGAFFMIRADIFREVGMFDENVFLFYEEDILAKKIKNIHKKVVSINSAEFVHYESQTIGKTFSYYSKLQKMYKSKMYYHEKYGNINIVQKWIFMILNVIRKVELVFEIPIRKLLKK